MSEQPSEIGQEIVRKRGGTPGWPNGTVAALRQISQDGQRIRWSDSSGARGEGARSDWVVRQPPPLPRRGDNGPPSPVPLDDEIADGAAGRELLARIEAIERLNEEIKTLQNDRKNAYAEAKADGYHVPAVKAVIKLRAETDEQRLSRLDTAQMSMLYRKALGIDED